MFTDILKKCGRGLLYIVTLPILLLVLAVYAVIGIVEFFFVGIKSILYFFSGRNLFGEFPEDIKAREILEGKNVTNINIVNEPPQSFEQTPPPPYITTPDKKEEETGITIETVVPGEEDKQ